MPASVEYARGLRLRRAQVNEFAETLADQVAKGRSFACLVTTPEELQRLNRAFRGKNKSTDVLSFPSALPEAGLGDLAISMEHARVQARERGHSMEEELGILMLHGLLHLLGMDHETDQGQMRRAETRWRKKLGLPDGLIERTSTIGKSAQAKPGVSSVVRGGLTSAQGRAQAKPSASSVVRGGLK